MVQHGPADVWSPSPLAVEELDLLYLEYVGMIVGRMVHSI